MSIIKPFYFFVVVWGKEFSDHLVNYCIPSLLAADNIPALHNRKYNKFLLCTTKQDWQSLKSNPIIIKLQHYVEVVFLEIPPPSPQVTNYQHMGIGHKLATHRCFKDKAYGIALTPDMMFANGTLAAVQKQALSGKHLIFCAAVRVEQESFLSDLHHNNFRSFDDETSYQQPLNISSRQLVELGLRNFHSETKCYDFDSSAYQVNSPVTLWRIPNQQGIILYSLSWCSLLIDYSVIEHHSTTTLDNWTIDGDYIYKNFKNCDHIHVCQDSDEMMILSWTPSEKQVLKMKTGLFRKLAKPFRQILNQYLLHETLMNPIFDPLKLKFFPVPVRWHVNDFNSIWNTIEKKTQKIVTSKRRWDHTVFHYGFVTTYYIKKILKYTWLTLLLCSGNRSAKQQLQDRIRLFLQEG